MSKLLLCDGHNLAFRAFYGIRELSRSDGMPTNMIHGWLKTFWRLEDELRLIRSMFFLTKGDVPEDRRYFQVTRQIEVFHQKVFLSNLNGLRNSP